MDTNLVKEVSRLIENRTGISSLTMYPSKVIYTETEREMATINASHLDFMKAMKEMRYDDMQNMLNQQSLMAQQAQNQMSQGLAGLGGGYGQMGGLGSLPQHFYPPSSPPTIHKPGLVEAFHGVLGNPRIKAFAEKHGFVLDFDSDCYKHPNGGFVSRRMLEDLQGTDISLHHVFNRAKSPNIHWLDDRIEEIRFKL